MNYDVAIVGAGIAGQVCANYLAREGRNVIMLEQNHHAGGNMSGFERKGFSFDGGDQSFESLGIVLPILRDLIGVGPDDFVKARYRMVSDDFDFFVESPEQVEHELQSAFPSEPGIAPLFREIKEVSRFLGANYDPWDFPLLNRTGFSSLSRISPWLPKLKKWSTFRYREKACSVVRDPGLRTWFTQVGYYRMPYLFFAGFWHIWSYDYWYPLGGMQRLHDRLTEQFREHGGTARFNTEVEKIDVDSRSGRACGVVTADGERIGADTVVYAADYRRLVNTILGPDHFAPRFVKRVNNARLTEEILGVYLGLSMSNDELSGHLGGAQHPFYFPNYNVIFPEPSSPEDVHRSMWVALNHFGAESPSAPEGKSTLTLQTYSSYRWQNYWRNNGESHRRTAEYREFKQKVGMELVELAEHLVPGLRDRIEYMEVGTPLSIERFSRNTNGSTGGWCYDDQVSPVWRFPNLNRIKTRVPNVLAAGHYALWPGGVISASLCGRLVANMLNGRSALAHLGEPTTR
ncbi:MAG: phytoene desaturase family protein [Spirochaetota bacterium]